MSMLPQGAMNSVSPTMRVRHLVFDVMRAHDGKIKQGRGAGPRPGPADDSRPAGSGTGRLSAPAVRRHEAAHRHHHQHPAEPAAAGRRRADLGAGRDLAEGR